MKPYSQPISEARKIESKQMQADLARLALAAWDPQASLDRKLAERNAAKAVR